MTITAGGEEDHDHGMPIFNLSTNEYGTHPENFVVQMTDVGLSTKLSGQIMRVIVGTFNKSQMVKIF